MKETLKKMVRELWHAYQVSYDYGYLHSSMETAHLLKKLKEKKSRHTNCPYQPEKTDRFIFIGDKNPQSTMRVAVFGDIDQKHTRKQMEFYTTRVLKNPHLKKLHDAFFRFNHIIPLPMKPLWDHAYTTWDIENENEDNLFIIFLGGAYFEETFSQPAFLEKIDQLSRKSYVSKVLYLVDPVDKFANIKNWFPYFDLICGCAMEDENKYGLHWIDTPCVQFEQMNDECIKKTADIHVRLQDNGRMKMVQDIHACLSENNIRCDFHVQTSQNQINLEGLEYTSERMAYKDMVKEELAAGIMLEIITPNIGAGATLRYKEAVMYGRKLLSNNPTLEKMPCYDPAYMHYFKTIEEIDPDWIKEESLARYNYQGEFSTDTFCEKIKKLALKA